MEPVGAWPLLNALIVRFCPTQWPRVFFVLASFLSLVGSKASGQSAVDANGMLLAQNSAIEQARLFARPAGTESTGMTADGTPLPNSGGNTDDESFGAQQILKSQPPHNPEFFVSADSSLFYTSNAALTRRDTQDDGISVTNAAVNWNHNVNAELQIQAGVRASLFRYLDNSALDFENLGAGIGATWAPRNPLGILVFGRYDFTELLDKHSHELLEDHEFTLGAQKVWIFNRVHALTVGVLGSVGISDPFAAQRDQIGGFAGYHVALARRFDAELTYRLSGFFYNSGSRDDLNQAVSLAFRYHFTPWAEAGALLSFGSNKSSRSAFDYDVLNTGGVLSLAIHF
jgi:hypothetical protein